MKRTIAFLATTLLALAAFVPAAPAEEGRFTLAPVNGYEPLVRLSPGDAGDDVAALQKAMTEAGFYHHAIDGEYGRSTASAVIAFHKYLDLERSDVFNALDWIRLSGLPDPGLPERTDEPDRIEIDLGRQLLFLFRDGVLHQVIPVSSGGGYTYRSARTGRAVTASTPEGDFRLKWHQRTWVCDPTTGWCVYKYWAFTDYYGIHGYRSVPTYPASHGCVRVETWDADWLESQLFVGMPVHIWRVPPEADPVPESPPDPETVAELFGTGPG
ncbi:MAG: L,D-transpeptidase family protein [Acidimicrobiia bacterium]|nr:MAG: L,D-transpeptidase family protein [Acidimicrobiia bacterium]